VKAVLVGRDPSTDTALLRAEASGLAVAPRTPAGALKVGQLVLAIGRPGEEPTLSRGVVSAIGGGWQLRRGGQAEALIQSDVTFYPGFSGGPLVDASGRVAGLNSSHLARGASISLPTAVVERTVEALLKHGRVKRGYLGIGTQVVPLPAALAGLVGGRERGLMIVTVAPDSPADRGGLLLGDILVGIAGQPVTNPEELQAQLGSDRVGQQVTIQVLRGGVPKEVQVTIGERPEQGEGR
jgi:S1-C subfamily serine protease